MSRAPDIAFRPVSPDDLAMLGAWMRRPHWRDWWGDPDVELGYVRDMIEGRDPTCDPFLFDLDGEPAGYIQVWSVGAHQTPEWAEASPWLMELPATAVGVDLSIADADKLSRGIGSRVVRRFTEQIALPRGAPVVIDPDPANARAVAAYRKAGFRPVPHLDGRTPGVLILQFDPGTDPS
jgi:aminoglycoside 6'-N-acetyltransferase